MAKKYSQLTREKRIKLEALYSAGMKPVEIAEQIGCHFTTVYREIKRGKTTQRSSDDWSEKEIYSYDKAQIVYEENKHKCGRRKIIQDDQEYIEFVEMMILEYHYSPAAVLQEINRDGMEFETKVCLTTLYNYIKSGVFPNVVLADCPYRRQKETRRKKKKVQKRFSKGKSIDERPKSVEKREEVGHWEMDSVVGPQGEGSKALLVLTERKTRKEILRLVNDHTSGEVVKTLNRIERELGEKKFRETFKTITVDNGVEFSDWKGMEKSRRNKTRRTEIYYCHAYTSCERASNENQNRMLRRWWPKGTNFDNVTKNEVKKVERWINDYPRLLLGWHTSGEVYAMEMKT